MKTLLIGMMVALLLVGCGGGGRNYESRGGGYGNFRPPPNPSAETRTPPKKVSPVPVNLSTSAVEGKPFTIADLSMDMLWVNPGTFEMGSPPEEEDRRDRETQHTVTLTEGYWLGNTP